MSRLPTRIFIMLNDNDNIQFCNPNYKIGIKDLTQEQLKQGLPNYEALLKKIEKIRSESRNVDKSYLENSAFETLKYDNIFSIIGGRGAGKTSVLFTLYKRLKAENNNIMLPIVMPELLDDNESIISWILSAIEISLKEIETKIIDQSSKYKDDASYQKMCDEFKFFDRCIFNSNNKLRKKFNELKQNFYNNENKNFGNDYSENTVLMAKSVQSGFQMISNFISYWNTLVEVYKQYLVSNNSPSSNPLIFVFIDDADLKPDIINELIFVIPKFLSHPNVVTVISGSHKTLALAVKYHMYKSITSRPYELMELMDIDYNYNANSYRNEETPRIRFSELRYGKEYDRISNLSDEILRKIFPVYNRFEIHKYINYNEKKQFQMFKDDTPTCEESIQLDEKISKLLNDYYDAIMGLHRKNLNSITFSNNTEPNSSTIEEKEKYFKLLVRDNDDRRYFTNGFYLSFFGNYARDISAVYYALKEMLEELVIILNELYNGDFGLLKNEIPDECIEKTRSVLLKFLDSALTSNNKYKMFIKHKNDMVKSQLLHWQLYIDYSKVLEIFNQSEYKYSNLKDPNPFIEMLCLLNFIEQIIVLMMPQRRKSHGINETLEFLDYAGIDVIQFNEDIDEVFKQYYVFNNLNIIPIFDTDKIEHQHNFLNAVERLNLLSRFNDHTEFIDIKWISLLAEVLYKRQSPYARLSKYQKELFFLKNRKYLDKKYNELVKSYYERLRANLSNPSINKQMIVLSKMQDDFLRNMESLYLLLENKISQIVVFFNDQKGDLAEQAKYLDYFENNRIKTEVASLMKLLNIGHFLRSELIRKMNNILTTIENDNNEYMELSKWYYEFDRILQSKIRVRSTDNNATYHSIIDSIESSSDSYILYYVAKIYYEINKESKSNLNHLDYEPIERFINPIIEQLEDREWRRLTESE